MFRRPHSGAHNEGRAYEELYCRGFILGAVSAGSGRCCGRGGHEAHGSDSSRGRGCDCGVARPRQYRCGASSDQRYYQRERTGQGMARGLSSVQDQKGRALLNREPAQTRAQRQAGGPHCARGGHLQHGVVDLRAARRRRGPTCDRGRPSPEGDRRWRCVLAAWRGGGRSDAARRARLHR